MKSFSDFQAHTPKIRLSPKTKQDMGHLNVFELAEGDNL
jgi:hypothetical protein